MVTSLAAAWLLSRSGGYARGLGARALLATALSCLTAGAQAFGLADVAKEAEKALGRPYEPAPADARLATLGYDAYRSIRFRTEQTLWREGPGPFQVHFYPRGGGNQRALRMFEVVDGQARRLEVPASVFRNDGGPEGQPADGAAGWRLHAPINRPDVNDEVIVFLGASYFRAVAKDLNYGLSARALAIDTVGGSGEEFPEFTAFWLERPAAGAGEARFWALLESPRAVGTYQFVVRPGAVTTLDVQARLWLRAPVARLGIAPLTSMFFSGENQPVADDYRPEVHDSDGLQLALGTGEWLWRPLVNPRGVFVTSFEARGLQGFGLMQRDRAFHRYEDLEARYDRRPSAWVQPVSDWGAGRVELMQFGTPDETNDNAVAYWVPQALPAPGQPLDLAWRISVGGAGLAQPPGAWVTQSRRGHGYRAGPLAAGQVQFHVDFEGPSLQGMADGSVEAVITSPDNASGLRAIAHPNAVSGGWRVTVDAQRVDPRRALELRLFLRTRDASGPPRILSETWSYALPPD